MVELGELGVVEVGVAELGVELGVVELELMAPASRSPIQVR